MEGRLASLENFLQYLNSKQVLLSDITKNVENNAQEAKNQVNEFTNQLRAIIDTVEETAKAGIETIVAGKRNDLEIISSNLTCAFPVAYRLFEMMKAERDSSRAVEKLIKLEKQIEDTLTERDVAAIEAIAVGVTDEWIKTLPLLPKQMSPIVYTNFKPNELSLSVEPPTDSCELQIYVTCLSGSCLSLFDLSNVVVEISPADGWGTIFGPKSIRQAMTDGQSKKVDVSVVNVTYKYDDDVSELKISVRSCGNEVENSPVVVNVKRPVWDEVGTGDITRSGKTISDLDKSELIAMNYEKTFVGEGLAVQQTRGKNVSFHENTQIVEMVKKVMAANDTTLANSVVDSTDASYEPVISAGHTKTTDGKTGIETREMMRPDPSWDLSKNSWEKFSEEKETEIAAINAENRKRCGMGIDEPPKWEDFARTPVDDFADLSPAGTLSLKYDGDENARGVVVELEVLADSKPALPQSIARDSARNLTFVSDVGKDVIHMYEGPTYHGYWPWSFSSPRYVLCIPAQPDVGNGDDVVVLDQTAMCVFKAVEPLNYECSEKLLPDIGFKYRGLAFSELMKAVVTTELTDTGVSLLFVDTYETKRIVKSILLGPTCQTEYHLLRAMCRYLTSSGALVYTSDMGLNCIYETNVCDGTTRCLYSTSFGTSHHVMGVAVDELGRILAAFSTKSGDLGRIDVISRDGVVLKTLKIDVSRPAGLAFDRKTLYVADVGTRNIRLFSPPGNLPE